MKDIVIYGAGGLGREVAAIIRWLRGEPVDPATLVPAAGLTFAKNDYLVKVG